MPDEGSWESDWAARDKAEVDAFFAADPHHGPVWGWASVQQGGGGGGGGCLLPIVILVVVLCTLAM